MADWEEVERIQGKHKAYSVRKKTSTLASTKYAVFDADSGKVLTGTFDSRANPVE